MMSYDDLDTLIGKLKQSAIDPYQCLPAENEVLFL